MSWGLPPGLKCLSDSKADGRHQFGGRLIGVLAGAEVSRFTTHNWRSALRVARRYGR